MLPRSKRVSKQDFPSQGSKKKTLISPLFSLTHTPSSQKARFSAVVSKKVASLAVDRNHLRRQIYVICSQYLAKSLSGIFVIYAKKGAKDVTFNEMKLEISGLLSKV
jgi:ribonuclease P protein component